MKYRQQLLEDILNLLTDMILSGASKEKISWVVLYSMEVMSAHA